MRQQCAQPKSMQRKVSQFIYILVPQEENLFHQQGLDTYRNSVVLKKTC